MIVIKHAKRFMACLLALVFLSGCLSVYAEEVYTPEELESFEDNVRLLSAFGLVEEGRAAATTVKRGDFAGIMLKYLGYGEEFYFEGTSFSDVPDRKSPIYGMLSLGLMSGNGDGTFGTYDDISVAQAAKVIVTALGYDVIADINGGYPTGYLSAAAQMELFQNTSAQPEETLTYYNLVQMLVNALSVNLIVTDFHGGFSLSDETWLSTRLDCEKRRGVVTSVGELSLDEGGGSKNTISIDGVQYETNDDYSYLLGAYTEFYADSSDTVIYISELRTARMEFDAEDVISYRGKTYTIKDDNGRERNYRLSQESYIVFNGAAASKLSEADMCPKYGNIALVDNNNDGDYDVVIINSFEIYVVQSVNQTEKRIYCRGLGDEFLDFSGIADEALTITDKNGNALGFEDIKSNSVIRTAFSEDNAKVTVTVSSDTVTGTVTKTENGDHCTIVYIDDVPYELADGAVDGEDVTAGRRGTFHLDLEGMIAYVSGGDASYLYGYLMNAYISETDALELKLIDESGSKQILEAAPKITVDALGGQNAAEALDLLCGGSETAAKQMIRYKTNGSGRVIEIDTPYNSPDNIDALPMNGESEDTLHLIYSGSTEYTKQLHNFRGKINVDADTVVFVVTGEGSDDYIVKGISDLPADTNMNLMAYSDDESEFYAKIIFTEDKVAMGGGSNDSVIGVIGKISEAVNDDGEIITRILFRAKNFETELDLEGNLISSFPFSSAEEPQYTPEVGDIVSLKYSGNEAREAALIYKPSEDLFPAGSSYGTLTDTRVHYMYGSVYSVEKGCMNVTGKDIEANGEPSIGEVESFRLSDFSKIFKCTDVDGRKFIEPATSADIIDYQTAGASCSKVFLSAEWEYPNILVIYE